MNDVAAVEDIAVGAPDAYRFLCFLPAKHWPAQMRGDPVWESEDRALERLGNHGGVVRVVHAPLLFTGPDLGQP
ncbi:MAG TPA: hypothetical protein VG276_26095 [Actinomycetes bacterium]|nr:hypothetical protein [Actinomycetes bacterium]